MQKKGWMYRGLGGHALVLPDVVHSREGAHRVGNIVGAVGEGHDHGREHLWRISMRHPPSSTARAQTRETYARSNITSG